MDTPGQGVGQVDAIRLALSEVEDQVAARRHIIMACF